MEAWIAVNGNGFKGEDKGPKETLRVLLAGTSLSADDVRTLPRDVLEPHPLVRELRQALQSKEASLADKDREIARLQVAITFGIKELPVKSRPHS